MTAEHDFGKFAPKITWDQAAIDAALDDGLGEPIMDQFMCNVAETLARGIPVTVTCMGKRFATYYPGGQTQHYDRDGCPEPPFVVWAPLTGATP